MAVRTTCTYIVVRTVVRPVSTHSLYLVGFVSCFIVSIPLGLVFVCWLVEKETRVLPWASSFANTNKKNERLIENQKRDIGATASQRRRRGIRSIRSRFIYITASRAGVWSAHKKNHRKVKSKKRLCQSPSAPTNHIQNNLLQVIVPECQGHSEG